MLKRHKWKIAVLCFAAGVSLTIGSSHAYILRGPHLLELMVQKSGQPKRMLVTQTVLFLHGGEAGATKAEETLRFVFPELFRADAKSENAERIHVTAKGASMTIIDGKLVGTGETWFDKYKDLLLLRSRDLLEDRLTDLGVDMSVVAFGRFEDKIAFVIGAEKPDDPVPQVWLDKESFLPIRWLMSANDRDAQKGAMEIRYAEWRQIGDVWYPMRILFFQGDRPVREIRAETLRTDLTFPPELFDMAGLKAKYASAVSESSDGSVSGEISDIEKSIDEFRKKYE